MFRRLYWIVEEVSDNGATRVTGVYTSIPDLIHRGLKAGASLRLTIHKPDTYDCPLGQWTNATFAQMGTDLDQFVQTHEYSVEEVKTLGDAVSQI